MISVKFRSLLKDIHTANRSILTSDTGCLVSPASHYDKGHKGPFKIKNTGKHVPTAQNEDLSAAAMVYRTA